MAGSVAVDVATVVVLFERDGRDLVGAIVVREDHHFGVLEVLSDDRGFWCELAALPASDWLNSHSVVWGCVLLSLRHE